MGAISSLATCSHPLRRCLLTIAQLVIMYLTSAPAVLLGRRDVSLVPGSQSVRKAVLQGLPLLLESVSPRVLKPSGFYIVHPLPSSLAHATRERPACICPRAPRHPSEVHGKDEPASGSTQQAACRERNFLSHWKHHKQCERKGLQKKEKNN